MRDSNGNGAGVPTRTTIPSPVRREPIPRLHPISWERSQNPRRRRPPHRIRILRAADNTTAAMIQLATQSSTPGVGNCAAMGTWHGHEIEIDPALGNIRIQFSFDSIDGQFNEFAGWFIDDLEVEITP